CLAARSTCGALISSKLLQTAVHALLRKKSSFEGPPKRPKHLSTSRALPKGCSEADKRQTEDPSNSKNTSRCVRSILIGKTTRNQARSYNHRKKTGNQ